jgi:threonine/homoserine/homoserine lactone efflux protein
MELIIVLLKGVLIGFISSIPLGPIGVLVIQRTLGKGRRSGFVSGIGAASADTMLALVAGLGLSMIVDFIKHYESYFQLIGGIFIIIVGAEIFFKNPIKQVRERRLKKNNLTTDYFSVLFLTLSNPVAVFLFLAMFAGLNIFDGVPNVIHYLIIFGVFTGASSYWFLLTSLVSIYRAKFRLRRLWWMNKITGIVIFIFGLAALGGVLISFFTHKGFGLF